jgi:hypothetical protein
MPERRFNCEKCGTYSYDFVDGYWHGVENTDIKAIIKNSRKMSVTEFYKFMGDNYIKFSKYVK